MLHRLYYCIIRTLRDGYGYSCLELICASVKPKSAFLGNFSTSVQTIDCAVTNFRLTPSSQGMVWNSGSWLRPEATDISSLSFKKRTHPSKGEVKISQNNDCLSGIYITLTCHKEAISWGLIVTEANLFIAFCQNGVFPGVHHHSFQWLIHHVT